MIPHTFLITPALRERLRLAKVRHRPETSEGAILRDALDVWLTAHGIVDVPTTRVTKGARRGGRR
jgi:hypothetical protein